LWGGYPGGAGPFLFFPGWIVALLFHDPYPYSIMEQKFIIGKVMGWRPQDVLRMPRRERIWYFERCKKDVEDYWQNWVEMLSKLIGG